MLTHYRTYPVVVDSRLSVNRVWVSILSSLWVEAAVACCKIDFQLKTWVQF